MKVTCKWVSNAWKLFEKYEGSIEQMKKKKSECILNKFVHWWLLNYIHFILPTMLRMHNPLTVIPVILATYCKSLGSAKICYFPMVQFGISCVIQWLVSVLSVMWTQPLVGVLIQIKFYVLSQCLTVCIFCIPDTTVFCSN